MVGTRLAGGRRPGVKTVLFGLVLVSLVGLVGAALMRDVSGGSRTAAASRPAVPTPRPALTAAEEGYAQALWPIHNDVKASALKLTMAGIQYKTGRGDTAGLKAQADASVETWQRSEGQLRELQPPSSLRPLHDEYLQAILLYQQAGAEMAKLYNDRRDDHLVTAFPLSQEAGQKLAKVGSTLWPGEYVPN